jgi:hypothetical protein
MVTVEEQRSLQREKAEADAGFWSTLQDLNANTAADHKEHAALATRAAAEAEARAKDAAEKAAAAKTRIDRLNKGETLTGGLGKPRVLTREDLIKAGFTESDLRHCENIAEFAALLGKDALRWLAGESVKASERWSRATVRKILLARRGLRVEP